jgi:hypothetical protein
MRPDGFGPAVVLIVLRSSQFAVAIFQTSLPFFDISTGLSTLEPTPNGSNLDLLLETLDYLPGMAWC